jgi:H+/Cl- antiporter ClcA
MPGGAPGGDVAKEAGTWLIIGVIAGFFCCCLGWVGAFFQYQAKDLATKGNMAEAQSKQKTGKTIIIVAVVIGVLIWILNIVMQVMAQM